MRVLLAVFSMVMLLTAASFAQITIHNTDFSPIGYSYTWGRASNATFSSGSSGANQTWTLGDFTWESNEQRTFVNPSTAPHGSTYPAATRAEHILPGNPSEIESYSYQQVTPTAYNWLGQVWGDSVVVFNPVMVNGVLPLSYNAQWHTLMRYNMHVDTALVTFQDSLVYSVDGWGTISTPYGSWPALRAFIHHWITVSYMGFPMTSYQFVQYMWVNQQGNSVAVLESVQNDTNPNFTTGTVAMMGVPLSAEPVRGPVVQSFTVGQNYPNPFNPTTEIPVTLQKDSRVTLDVFNEVGQLVSHEEQMLAVGSHQLAVNASRWTSGMYFARVSAGTQQRVLKMNLLK
jgi:hypothetical protein